jgi:hypothetical protein
MNEPIRLSRRDSSDVAARLIRSAKGDVVPQRSRAAAFGMVTVAASGTRSALFSGAAPAASFGAWVRGTFVACCVLATLVAPSRKKNADDAPRSSPTVAAVAPRPNDPRDVPAPPSEVAQLAAPAETATAQPLVDTKPKLAAPAPPLASSIAAAPTSAPVPSAQPKSTLAEEILALDGVRRALSAGQPSRALVLLDDYANDFTTPQLAPEATALRIQALWDAGRHDEACALASRFVTTNAKSPLSSRFKTLCNL